MDLNLAPSEGYLVQLEKEENKRFGRIAAQQLHQSKEQSIFTALICSY